MAFSKLVSLRKANACQSRARGRCNHQEESLGFQPGAGHWNDDELFKDPSIKTHKSKKNKF